ncbi:metabolite traffic protein EboE [Fibrella aquatica]|uniref:metabolite traffic protein EboE n=1 Tax=Fibrella aquatica TaxID=3242487 RepID=UPI0035216690
MHIGYCTNIHPGETWDDHFRHLRDQVPAVKAAVSPNAPLPLGLRLANQASIDLARPEKTAEFQAWLAETGCYVFTMNGFPYGGFHNERVKDQVHAPDWTTTERLDYTIRLFHLLAKLMPEGETDGGISTSPLSYRLWWNTAEVRHEATQTATQHILRVLDELIQLRLSTGKTLHLDIEPEPDGLLDNVADFIAWYTQELRPAARTYLAHHHDMSSSEADTVLQNHIQLCYDVCHVAVAYEETETVLTALETAAIKVGKVQVSSALRLSFEKDAQATYTAISAFDEPTYLHQVVARLADGTFKHYDDLPNALADFDAKTHREWRVHFHVPLFLERYGLLHSTQNSVIEVLNRQRTQPFTTQLEIETYTWGVLPADVQVPISESISRELAWVNRLVCGL